MRKTIRTLGLAAVVASAALVPLHGDPRSNPVSHAEWARMVLRGLELLSDEPGLNDTAEQAFATLSGRESRSWTADRYVESTRLEVSTEDRVRRVRPEEQERADLLAVVESLPRTPTQAREALRRIADEKARWLQA